MENVSKEDTALSNIKVHCYALCHNEEKILPFFLDHYSAFCDKIFILDGNSTDSSRDIIKKYDCAEILPTDSGESIDERVFQNIKNTCWVGSDADWVIVCDVDELVWAPNLSLISLLQRATYTGSTIIRTEGFDLYTKEFPDKLTLNGATVKGIYSVHENKPLIFNPQKVQPNYQIGAHRCNPTGDVKWGEERIFNLHLRYLGHAYIVEKSKRDIARHSDYNKSNHFGYHAYDYAVMPKEKFDTLETSVIEVPFKVITDYPVALDSPDHIIPVGTKNDDNTSIDFIEYMCSIIRQDFCDIVPGFLDLGCSSGRLVNDFKDVGFFAIGLEGSDYSLKLGRSSWKHLANKNLFTCDISKPFSFCNNTKFHLITMWDVIEHIAEKDLPTLMENIHRSLHVVGYLIGTTSDEAAIYEGVEHHLTRWNSYQWRDFFKRFDWLEEVNLNIEDKLVRWNGSPGRGIFRLRRRI